MFRPILTSFTLLTTVSTLDSIDYPLTLKSPSSHTDLAPTLFKLADIPLRDDFDGLPIPVKFADYTPDSIKTEHVNFEYWGGGIIEGTVFDNLKGYFDHNTYKTLRIVSEKYEFMYTVW
ncbi:hypothetical protein ACQRIT_005123 [Beauveria bassiana]